MLPIGSWLPRIALIGGLALGWSVAAPRLAHAHATLTSCSIAAGATLSAAPKLLSCAFAEGVDPKGSYVRVFESGGDKAEVDGGNSAVSFSNAKQITVGLPRLGKGSYTVLWYTVSADDGHKAGGAFTFAIK